MNALRSRRVVTFETSIVDTNVECYMRFDDVILSEAKNLASFFDWPQAEMNQRCFASLNMTVPALWRFRPSLSIAGQLLASTQPCFPPGKSNKRTKRSMG